MGVHWQYRTNPRIELSAILTPEPKIPERVQSYLLCWGCAADLGLERDGDELKHNQGTFRHPSYFFKNRAPNQELQQAAFMLKAKLGPSVSTLFSCIQDIRSKSDRLSEADQMALYIAQGAIMNIVTTLNDIAPQKPLQEQKETHGQP